MRTTSRTILSALVAAPLLVGAVVPASAAEQGHVKTSGKVASFQVDGPESSDAIPGNYVSGGLDVVNGEAMGYLGAYDCADGAVPWEGEGCTYLTDIWLDGMVSTSATKGKVKATVLTGDVHAYSWTFDEETGEEFFADYGLLPLDVSVSPYGKAIKQVETYSYRDANTGETYSYRATSTGYNATASGTLGTIEVGPAGFVGSYKSTDQWKTP